MGIKLHLKRFSTYILSISIFLGCAIPVSLAQIAISDSRLFEVSFTTSASQFQRQSAVISVYDFPAVFGDAYRPITESWNPDLNPASAYFISEGAGTGVQGLRSSESDRDTFAEISFNNQAGVSFQGLTVAFDFLYKSQAGVNYSYILRYRVNSNEWKDVPGGIVSSENLRTLSDGWNSFSIQSYISDLYLRQNDEIRFKWIPAPGTATDTGSHLAIQQIELNPAVSTIKAPERGSLIITEILPASAAGAEWYEYIEVYNPTPEAVSLKGMSIVSQAGEAVVQNDLQIEPYQFSVLSNRAASTLNGLSPDYVYPGRITGSSGGYIELQIDGREVAKATYESPSPGVALELNRVSNSFDGYTSLQHLSPSSTEFTAGISGSPGRAGSTNRLFTNQFSGRGLHLVTAPGLLPNNLNRQSSLEFASMSGLVLNPETLNPSEPFLIVKEESDQVRLFAEEPVQARSVPRRTSLSDNAVVITVPVANRFNINSLVNEFELPVSPVVLIWNAEKRSFQLKYGEDTELNSWTPVIVNRDTDAPARLLPEERTSAAPGLDRHINMRLFEEQSGNRELLVDEALLGFVDRQRLRTDKRFDLQKFYPLVLPDEPAESITTLYLSNSLSSVRSNSFTHLPYELDTVYRVGVGFKTSKNSFQGILDWSGMTDIPDEWIISLEDRVTGSVIDMREQTNYRFRSSTGPGIDTEDAASTPFKPVEPAESERFVITVKPFEAALEASGTDTQPGSIELRQNYPNPFNPSTNIAFYLPEDRHVRIAVYNVVGQQVALLLDDSMGAGDHSVAWNAMDMPSGIYIVQLETGNRIFTRKITLIK
jgi:hypothetical protein